MKGIEKETCLTCKYFHPEGCNVEDQRTSTGTIQLEGYCLYNPPEVRGFMKPSWFKTSQSYNSMPITWADRICSKYIEKD